MTPLQKLLISDGAFVTPAQVLESLTASQAQMRPDKVPHSLYEELWHTDFWQRLILSVIRNRPVIYPEHAAESWPDDNETLTDEAWHNLIERFLTGLEEATALSGSQRLEETAGDRTVREQLESIVAHNAYHFGRMVFLRQLLGLWPPPSGGDTW